ncbi:MAG: SRPBCC family protein [Chloroflexota bacterium]
MAVIDQTVDVHVPLRTAYDQWTQFEDFPRFMEGVEQVHQLNDTTLEWRAKIAGVEKSWRARIVEQVPDQRITWVATTGARNDGTVSFSSLGAATTRVNLLMDVEPEGPIESAGNALGLVRARIKGDLERFRDFIEERGTETGGWRGEVREGQATGTGSDGQRGGLAS